MNNKIIGIHKEGNYFNKNKGLFLNYPIKEFIQNEILLKKFNNIYKLNIKNTKLNILNLNNYNLGNEGLNELSKINFNELKVLDLHKNKISNIIFLKKLILKNEKIIFICK